MATRSSRKTTTITSSSTSTPKASTSTPISGSAKMRSSPLSPTRISRMQEKEQLQNLNDRLAAYIDRVRNLESENNRLNIQVSTIQESSRKEVSSVKNLYEQELADARKLLDETAKEKAQLQIDAGKLRTDNEELRLRLLKKERDLANAEKSLGLAEEQVNELTGKLQTSDNLRERLQIELKDLKDEVGRLARQLAEAKKQLEAETLMRVDLENRCQSYKEELQFKQHVYETEISETKSKKMVEISEIDGKLQQEYEARLQEGLIELREQYEEELRNNRADIEKLYDNKIDELNRRISRSTNESDAYNSQMKDARNKVSELSSRLSLLESTNATLLQRVADLEAQLEEERDNHKAEVEYLKEEIARLNTQMSEQLQEYQDLMDIKIALDMEIAAYRKLLESEETRLNLSQSQSKSMSQVLLSEGRETPIRRTPLRGTKRKRTVLEDTQKDAFQTTSRATGDLEISEECPEGGFIKIENKGTKDASVGSFQLVRKCGENETIFKFHRNSKIPAGTVSTIYSNDQSQTHEPPAVIVMKNQKWVCGDEVTTTLLNSEKEEIASRHSKKQHDVVKYSLETDFSDEDIELLERKRIAAGQSPEKCSIQ